MGIGEGRIKRGRKYDQVVEGARQVFLQDGFEGASVDLIARAAGVSKATLYSYFPDKRQLFMVVATAECRRQATGGVERVDPDLPPETVLERAADRISSFVLSDFGQSMLRIVIAESGRFPELAQEFWVSGLAQARAVLIEYFRAAVARGRLEITDVELAADQFIELCKAGMATRLMIGLGGEVTEADRQRVARGAVEMFLARYGVAQSTRRTSS